MLRRARGQLGIAGGRSSAPGLGQTVAGTRQGLGDVMPDQGRDAEIRGGMLSHGSSHLPLAPPGQA